MHRVIVVYVYVWYYVFLLFATFPRLIRTQLPFDISTELVEANLLFAVEYSSSNIPIPTDKGRQEYQFLQSTVS